MSEGEFFPYLLQQRLIEAEDVCERTIGDAPLALEQPHHRRQQRVETPLGICHALGVWFHGQRLACPDQDFAILIDGKPLPLDELKREVLQCLGIEVEMPLEHAVGQTSSTLEHGDRLIQNVLKRHTWSSLSRLIPRRQEPIFPYAGPQAAPDRPAAVMLAPRAAPSPPGGRRCQSPR